MMNLNNPGIRFKKIRKGKSLTQREVSEYLKITTQTISNWERGANEPRLTPRQMVKLCTILDCHLETLADWLDGVKELPNDSRD